jgi:UDP:flavonoid glycosyltransferase YjiC (YdhE family)
MKEKKVLKRLLFVSGPGLGHVSRLIPIGDALRAAGEYEIAFTGDTSMKYRGLIEAAGYVFHPLPRNSTKINGVYFDLDTLPRKLEMLIDDLQPDGIIVDTGLVNLYSVMRWPKDIPRILVTNVFVTRLSGYRTLQADMFEPGKEVINRRRHELGLAPLDTPDELYEADLVCLADPHRLVREFADLPANYISCGASYWESDMALPADVPDLQSGLIFSMGSTGRAAITAQTVAHLKQITGATSAIYAGKEARNVGTDDLVDYAATMLPLQHFYRDAKLAITQGGAGSTYQALSYGVPVAILPTHRNHEVLGEALEKLGVGRLVSTPEKLLAFEAGDYERMARCARDFAAGMKDECGARDIAHQIGEFLEMQDAKPPARKNRKRDMAHPAPAGAGRKKRQFRYARAGHGALSDNAAHNFALSQTMMIFGANACYSWIPKNACSTLQFSVARANGCISELEDINWIHPNIQSFRADTQTAFRADYTFAILRCPFERLYSAYMDKLVNFDMPAWKLYAGNQRRTHPHDLTFRGFVTGLAATKTNSFDMHWRPQSDFMLFKAYDDLFALENFDPFIATVKRRIGLEIVDTRQVIELDTSRAAVDDTIERPFDLPALDLLNLLKDGRRPAPRAMFDPEIVAAFKGVYKRDMSLYRRNFGASKLMDLFS